MSASAISIRAVVLLSLAGSVFAQSPSETLFRLHPARAKTFVKASSDPDERANAPSRGNDDGFSGLNRVEAYRERVGLDEVAVLADIQGRSGYMGVFFRNFWSGLTGRPLQPLEKNRTQILVNGVVRHDHPLEDYFRNDTGPGSQVAPFDGPFTANRAGGHLTHTPIAWESSFKVQVFDNSFDNAGRFHKVAGSLASPEELLEIPNKQDWEGVYSRIGGWRHLAPRVPQTRSFTLGPSDENRVGRVVLDSGPATILELRCSVDDPRAWNDIVARFRWDGMPELSVDVPLRMLGSMRRKPFSTPMDSLMFGNDGVGEIWSYFPMHFEKEAELEFVNTGDRMFQLDVTWATQLGAVPQPWGYFSAYWQRDVTTPGVSFPGTKLENVRGMLRHIALDSTLDTSGRIKGKIDIMHLEGDLCVRVNGNRGDDHNFAASETSIGKWGWYGTPSDVPFVGDTSFNTGLHLIQYPNGLLETNRIQGSTFIFDPIHFVDGIDIVVEHGVQNLSNADYGLFTIFYLQPGAAREQVLEIDVGDATSEAAANVLFGTAVPSQLTSAFFRDQFFATAPLTDDVRFVRDWYRFTVSDPSLATAKGVCVGFRLDRPRLGDGGLVQARLFVDGFYAGLLHSYSSNERNRWKEGGELEVELPRSLTDGKTSFVVEVRSAADSEPLVIGNIKVFAYSRD